LPARQDIEDIDCVFYCSGYGQPAKFLHDKTKTILLNLVGVNSCIKKVKDGGSFLFLSTSEVYGDNPITPTPEDFVSKIDPQNNRFCYIAAKQLAETICLEQSNRINIKIARIALTYGPGTLLSDTRVLQSFIFRAHNEDKIQLLDAGDSIRNYLYISECVHKLLVMLLYGKEAIYNVGGYREPISIFELAKMIGNKTNRPVFKGVSANKSFIKDAPKSVCLNMSKYNKEFKITDFEFVGIKEGIQNLMEWYGY
jgi:dTDP-glucose 4,6-dehydratase/UDP-glucuronate decarboxylase